MQYKKLVLLMLLAPLFMPLHATHFMGGEITWECTPQGNFRFTMIIYRECYNANGNNAATFGQTVNMQSNVPGFATIQMNRISLQDMSPTCGCPGGPNIYCPGMPGGTANMGAMQENHYTSDAAYPNGVPLTGVPPGTGWYFSYGICCRNPSHNIQNAQSQVFTLRAFMFPYNNTPVNTCYDNSPVFRETPSPVHCISQPVTIAPNVFDPDGDSLVFAWAQPLNNNINTPLVNYFPGYSFTSPLPGTMHNPNNIPAALDPESGVIRFTSYTNGAFVTVTRITSYKNGIKVSEVYRELQVVLLTCGTNTPPAVVVSPYITQINPQEYHTTVTVGDSLSLLFMLTDNDTCPGTSSPQEIWLRAYGEQFGQPINAGTCTSPPCAELSPSPTDTTPLIMQGVLTTAFGWRTSLDHLDYSHNTVRPKRHTFYLHYQDNHCPVPGSGWITLHVDVALPYDITPVDVLCIQASPGGDIHITWEPSIAPPAAFDRYDIMTATNPQGPFTLAGQESNINATGFTHQPPGSPEQDRYYYINTHITQPLAFALPSSRVTSMMRLEVITVSGLPDNAFLYWTEPTPHTPSGAPPLYEVYCNDGNGWQLIHHTHGLTYKATLPSAGQTAHYRIESSLTDPSGTILVCRNISNKVTVQLISVPEEELEASLPFIFPNPSQGSFTLHPGSLQGDATVQIIAADGSTVKHLQLMLEQSRPCQLELSSLAPGFYLVVLSTDHGHHTLKLLIE